MTDDTATDAEGREPADRRVASVAAVVASVVAVFVRLLLAGLLLGVSAVLNPERRARAQRWVLLDGNRWLLVALLVGSLVAGTFLLSLTDVVGVAEGAFVATTFGAAISGLFSFVPIVITVNQLTVSRLFGSPEQVRAQIDDVDALRREFGGRHPSQSVCPTEPAQFLALALEVVDDRVDALERAVADAGPEATAAIEEFADIVHAQTDHVGARLDGTDIRLIQVLPAMMGDSYSRNVNDVRHLRSTFADDLSLDATAVLDDLEESFIALDVLRQYYKALYLTQELSHLSRLIGYTGIGAFVVATLVIMAFANGQPMGGQPLLLDALLSVAFGVVFLPFAVLLSFILRVATIAKRTAAPGTFTPRRETPAHATHRGERQPAVQD